MLYDAADDHCACLNGFFGSLSQFSGELYLVHFVICEILIESFHDRTITWRVTVSQ